MPTHDPTTAGKPPPTVARVRVLVVDDEEPVHQAFRRIFGAHDGVREGLGDAPGFDLDFATSAEEALEIVRHAAAEARPVAVAFVDVRMPEQDGVAATQRMWEVDPDLQVVLITGHSDYSWSALWRQLGHPDHLLFLRKPFEAIEVVQLAHALGCRWVRDLRARSTEGRWRVAAEQRLSKVTAERDAARAALSETRAAARRVEALQPEEPRPKEGAGEDDAPQFRGIERVGNLVRATEQFSQKRPHVPWLEKGGEEEED